MRARIDVDAVAMRRGSERVGAGRPEEAERKDRLVIEV